MFWINWILNSLVFLLIFNLPRIVTNYKNKTQTTKPVSTFLAIYFPLGLALILTVVDSLRLYFAYQILILIIAGGLFYWVYSKKSSQ